MQKKVTADHAQIKGFEQLPSSALLPLRAVVIITGRSKASLYRDHNRGSLPFTRVGCSTRVKKADLIAYMNGEVVK